jgi:hypothetical protein
MVFSDEQANAINEALRVWRQGDLTLDPELEFIHLADISRPHSLASIQTAEKLSHAGEDIPSGPVALTDAVDGLVMVSQTCDIVRNCRDRPFVEVAPLVTVEAESLESVRRFKIPSFAYISAVADQCLVADLDRTMTIEKALAADWRRIPGWSRDDEIRALSLSLSRKRSRFAFPDDFVRAVANIQKRLVDKNSRQSDEGAHIRAIQEIRVRAAPSWNADEVYISFWFIKESDPADARVIDWVHWTEEWLKRFTQQDRFILEPPTVARLDDMTARDYVESDRLDLDRLSLAFG